MKRGQKQDPHRGMPSGMPQYIARTRLQALDVESFIATNGANLKSHAYPYAFFTKFLT